MGVEEMMRKADEFWGPIERDVDDEGLVRPRDEDMVVIDDEVLGVETRYIRIRQAFIEENCEDEVPYVRLIGDLGHQDVEMRLPISMLASIQQQYAAIAAEMAARPGPGVDPA